MTICSLFRALGGKVFPGKISTRFPAFIVFEEIIGKNGSERRFSLRISSKFPDFIVFEEIIEKNGSERRFLLRISSKFPDFIVFEEIIGKSAAKTLPREKHFPTKSTFPRKISSPPPPVPAAPNHATKKNRFFRNGSP